MTTVFESMPYLDSDASVAITIKRMCEFIRRAARDSYFAGAARAVPSVFGKRAELVTQFQTLACTIADWWFAREFIRFTLDADLVRRLVGLPEALEALVSPEVMIRCVQPEGDCDCFSMFICGLLECQGIPWELVTLACSQQMPGVWSHIFPRAVIGSLHLPLDASHGKFPGWQVPKRDWQRAAVWGRNGEMTLADSDEAEVM